MSQRNNDNEILRTFLGILLLIGCHVLAVVLIFAIAFIADMNGKFGSYAGLQVLIIGGVGFLFWQLLYVIPLCIFLQRKGQIGLRNGVIIGASITALVNGGCFLLFTVGR